jgi:sortase A
MIAFVPLRSHAVKAAAVGATAIGLVCIAQGTWIHAKAALAQVLIASAWSRAQSGQKNARPWPWADTTPLARLIIGDGANAEALMVLEGTSGRNLAFGPAHDPASVRPGDPGNSVIEGHRDTHFGVLKAARVGGLLRVETAAGRSLQFQITDVRVVDSRIARIALAADHPRLTLITCYPFDAVLPGGPLRWVVTADLVGNLERETRLELATSTLASATSSLARSRRKSAN